MNVVELSGGVGGARLARGLDRAVGINPTIVVNIGDDEDIHGLHVSPDIDTVLYTLAGVEGPHGWGRRGDSFVTNAEIGRLGGDNTFQLGDLDLALNILRTQALRSGTPLSGFVAELSRELGIGSAVVPSSDDRQRTIIHTVDGETLAFQEYFVFRHHEDEVARVEYQGDVTPAPGVIAAIDMADVVVIAPSNPPLSIWPILAVPEIESAVRRHPRVIAVSPLFAGKALKGPADKVMASLGLAPGNQGVAEAYDGLIDELIIDESDAADATVIPSGIEVRAMDTRIAESDASIRFCKSLLHL